MCKAIPGMTAGRFYNMHTTAFNTPRFSASAIKEAAPIRHFTGNETLTRFPLWLKPLHRQKIKRLMRTNGVLPIASALLLYTAIPKFAGVEKAASAGHDYSLSYIYIQNLNYHTFFIKFLPMFHENCFIQKYD